MKTHLELIVIKLFDLHCDTLTECFDRKTDLNDCSLAVNSVAVKKIKNYVQNFAIFISEKDANPTLRYREVMGYGKRILARSGFNICTTSNDLNSAVKRAKPAAILSLEGGSAINSLEFLDELYDDGVRIISLAWNHNNHLAGGALESGGLTDFGRRVIARMNELGLVLDLSHLNRKSFFEAVDLAERVIATHSGLFDLVPHKRNLVREQLNLIKEKNGLLGLCFYPEFLGKPVFDNFKTSVLRLLNDGFEDIMAIGSDFDGALMDRTLSNLGDVPTLYDYLYLQNIPNVSLCKMFFDNSYNFFTRVLTNS